MKLLNLADTAPPQGAGGLMPPSPEECAGEFPGYDLGPLIGAGGMGAVYEAWDPSLERKVAIKVLPPSVSLDEDLTMRFQREARALARLKHRNVVTVHDFGTTSSGLAYFVMELVEGTDLAQALRGSGPPDLFRTVEIFSHLCDAITAAHQAGIVHRDLKPSNILVDPEGWIKVADFGLAKMTDGAQPASELAAGTPVYMAPEQERGEADERTDIYTLGVVLYELLTGQRPSGAFASPSDLRPLDPRLDEVVRRAMQREPARRFQSVRELKSAFLDAAGGPAALSTPEGGRTATLLFAEIPGLSGRTRTVDAADLRTVLTKITACFQQCLPGGGGRLLETAGMRIHAEFPTPSEAVRAALRCQWQLSRLGLPLLRVGLHVGEVRSLKDAATGREKPFGPAVDLAARLMEMAQPGQILVTRGVFSEARQFLREHPEPPERREAPDEPLPPVAFLAHGRYRFRGDGESLEEPLQVCEIGAAGLAPLQPPKDTDDAWRHLDAGEAETLGWRPSVGQEVPGRAGWHLEKRLGEGGFGEAWLARHLRTREERVFKFCFDADRLRSFRREEKLFVLLKSALGDREDIATIHETQTAEKPYFIESKYYPEGNLLQWAQKQGGLAAIPLEVRLRLVAQTARTVGAAHAVGVIHKDLKPSNILVRLDAAGTPHPVLADFGIGTLADPAALEQMSLTQGGFSRTLFRGSSDSQSGTQLYMPPEYLTGRPPGILGDVYALGIILYQLAVADAHRALAVGWEQDVSDALLREDIATAVHGSLEKRLQSAEALAQRVESLASRREALRLKAQEQQRQEDSRRTAEQAAKLRERLRRTRKLVAAFAVLSSAAIGAAGFGWHQRNQSIAAARESENARIQAQKSAAESTAAQQEAETARKVTEDDMFFLMNDLRGRLQETGQYVLLNDIANRIIGRFESAGLRTQQDVQSFVGARDLRGDIRLAEGNMREALASYRENEQLLEQWRARFPDESALSASLASTCDRMGDVLLEMNRDAEAEQSYEKSLLLRRKMQAAAPGDIAEKMPLSASLARLGNVFRHRRHFERSLQCYSEALHLREEIADKLPDAYNLPLARLLRDAGFAYKAAGMPGDAVRCFDRSTAILRDLAARFPDRVDLNNDYAGVLSEGVRITGFNPGNFAIAAHSLQQAVDIRQVLADSQKTNLAARMDLADSIQSLALMRELQGKTGEADALFQKGMSILNAVIAQAVEAVAWQIRAVECTKQYGEFLERRGRQQEAEETFRLALTNAKRTGSPRTEAACQGEMGGYLSRRQQDSAALQHWQAELEIRRRLHAVDPTPDSANDLASVLASLAWGKILEHKTDEARPLCEEAAALTTQSGPLIQLLLGHLAMMENRTAEARDIYEQGLVGEAEVDGTPWLERMKADFAEMKKRGIDLPLMQSAVHQQSVP
ncbi:MAG: protein kinase [Verrucomicrobiales bacterium]|nr:protein kinase [Verrucomicrobiales bacterium]